MKVTFYSDFQASELKTFWDQMDQKALDQPFVSKEWCEHFYAAFKPKGLWVGVVEDNGAPQLIVPLVGSGKWVKNFEILGDPRINDYAEPLCATAESRAFEAFKRELFRRHPLSILRFHNVRDLSCFYTAAKTNGHRIEEWICENPFLPLSEVALSKVSSSTLRDIRYCRQRMERESGQSLRFHPLTAKEEIDTIYTQFANCHKERQKEKVGADLFDDPTVFSFLKAELKQGKRLQLSTLRIGEQPISFAMHLVQGERIYYWIPTFLGSCAAFSPGKVHLHELIQWAKAQGFSTFDFMIGNESYKRKWTQQVYNCFRITYYSHISLFLTWGMSHLLWRQIRSYYKRHKNLQSLWHGLQKWIK